MNQKLFEIIGQPQFLIQKGLDSAGRDEELKLVREYALSRLENFLEILGYIKDAHLKLFKEKKYFGKEVIGHGIASYGNSFSLRDYNYVENVITPAIEKYYKEKPDGWDKIWDKITSLNIDEDNPVFLKRGAIPVLINDLKNKSQTNEVNLNVLKNYMSINHGIPHLTDIIFENVRQNKEVLPKETQLELLKNDIKVFNTDEEKYWEWYFRSIFAFEILFELINSPEEEVALATEQIIHEWLSTFEDKLFNILITSHFDYAFEILLKSERGKNTLIQIIGHLINNHAEELSDYDRALDPTQNISFIFALLLSKYPDHADQLIAEVERNGTSYVSITYLEKVLILALEELASREQFKDLVNKMMEKYSKHLQEGDLASVRTELADKYSRSEDIQEREKAYQICNEYLTKGLKDPAYLAGEYSAYDENLKKDQGTSIVISGIEGKCLFILHRLAKDHPENVYKLAMNYWKGAKSAYLIDMASLPLHSAIAQILYAEKEAYNYQRARKIFEEFAGSELSELKGSPYNFLGVWRGISNVIALLRPVLKLKEVITFLQLGKGKEHTHWVLAYYVKFHGDVPREFEWNSAEQKTIEELFAKFLSESGNENDITQLLTEIRNNILKDKSGKEDVEIVKQLIEQHQKRHYQLISTVGHLLIDAAKKNDKKYLDIVELYYRRWVIPFVIEMPKDIGFVYIPRTSEVLNWFYGERPNEGRALASNLQDMPSDWQKRIFLDLDLADLAK